LWTPSTAVWTTAANWLPAAEPLTTDHVIIGKASAYGITGAYADERPTAGGTLGSFLVEAGFTQAIGTRENPLNIEATIAAILGTGAIYLTGTMATLTLANGANTNIVDCEGEVPAVTTLNMISGTARHTDGAITTVNAEGGALTYGTAGKCTTAITTLNIKTGARVYYNSNATIATLNGYPGGYLDLSGESRALTITTFNWWEGFHVYDPFKRLTATTVARQTGGTW